MNLDVKLKGVPAEGRLEDAGAWNTMFTHRVRITNGAQIDEEVVGWLKQAYIKA
jgi:hypothetical protein